MATQQIQNIPVDGLMPDPTQPRKQFAEEDITRLAASITARGMLQPIRVRWDETRKTFWIISGESRWRAAKLAGLKTVPCLPVIGELTETEILSDQIIENTVRNSLRPMELARALARLKALTKCTSQQLAAELGISGSAISKAESLLTLPVDVQSMVDDGRVPSTVAYELSKLPDEQARREMAHAVASGGMSRERVADAVQARMGKRKVSHKSGRIACKLEGGVSVTLSSGQPWTWDDLLAAIDRVRREAKKLCDNGKEISALAKSLRVS